jgi:outer membrane protein OmpA-like peptidoglycan-associated protein
VARVKANEAGGEESAAWLPADLAAVRAEILRAQQHLMGLSAELDKATRGEPSTSLEQLRSEIEAIQIEIDGVNATLVRAHFAPGSALLALSADTKNAILAAAQRANRIRIRGRADASGSAAGNEALARERALSMRRLLVDGGIAADRLQTSFTRGDYIAPNSTLEGRAQNRRVDVLFENNKNEPVPVARNQLTEEGAR